MGYALVTNWSSNAQDQLDGKLESVGEDLTPALGGNLTLGGNVVIHNADGMKRGPSSSDFVEEEYIHATTLTASTTAVIAAFTYAKASFEGLEISYKIKAASGTGVRIGTIRVANDGASAIVLNDVMTETIDTKISFAVFSLLPYTGLPSLY